MEYDRRTFYAELEALPALLYRSMVAPTMLRVSHDARMQGLKVYQKRIIDNFYHTSNFYFNSAADIVHLSLSPRIFEEICSLYRLKCSLSSMLQDCFGEVIRLGYRMYKPYWKKQILATAGERFDSLLQDLNGRPATDFRQQDSDYLGVEEILCVSWSQLWKKTIRGEEQITYQPSHNVFNECRNPYVRVTTKEHQKFMSLTTGQWKYAVKPTMGYVTIIPYKVGEEDICCDSITIPKRYFHWRTVKPDFCFMTCLKASLGPGLQELICPELPTRKKSSYEIGFVGTKEAVEEAKRRLWAKVKREGVQELDASGENSTLGETRHRISLMQL